MSRSRSRATASLVLLLALAACDNPFGADGDRSAPRLTLSSPAAGHLVDADSVVVEGVAQDNRGVEQSVPITAGREASFAFTVRGTAPGEHTLLLRARDEAGNAGERTVRFTTASAEVKFTRPKPDTAVSAFVVALFGGIVSAVPLQRYSYSVNGNDAGVILAHAKNTRTGKQGVVLLKPKG
jgi:hypothetical protein